MVVMTGVNPTGISKIDLTFEFNLLNLCLSVVLITINSVNHLEFLILLGNGTLIRYESIF